MIIQTARGDKLNGLYNAGDIGLIVRRFDRVNSYSSPTKIPEYLATCNAILVPEYLGDFGIDLQGKKYALIKKNITELLDASIDEIKNLSKPDSSELDEIIEKYSTKRNQLTIQKILRKHFLKISG